MKIYVLIEEWVEDYEGISAYEIKGITRNRRTAFAWEHATTFSNLGCYHKVVIMNEFGLGPEALKLTKEFSRSPFCTCGHRKIHHLNGPKRTTCLYKGHGSHKCRGFILAENQEDFLGTELENYK